MTTRIPIACTSKDMEMFYLINHHVVNNRLRRVSELINAREVKAASVVINRMLRNLRSPDVKFIGIGQEDIDAVFNYLYRALVQLGMRRYDSAHDCIRDLHYNIMSV